MKSQERSSWRTWSRRRREGHWTQQTTKTWFNLNSCSTKKRRMMSYNDSLLPGVKNSYCSSWSLSCPCLWIQEEKEGESICSSLSQLIISLSLSFQPHKPFPSSSLILVSHWFSLSFFVIITKNHRMEGKRMKESKELLRLPLSFPSFILPLKFLLHLLFTHHLSQFLFRFFSINSVLHHQSLSLS